MKTQVIVKTCLGNVVHVGHTTKDVGLFSVKNRIRTKMQLKFGPAISVEFVGGAR